ncbi:DUF2471 family protein [Burkholderia ubonensis]|nr:hypothetical protein [Burkholderia ubonensis]KVZ71028.1 hypothetical protein WL20_32660 [Burkholderia ubonensis]KWN68407.1 hypothetical protein WM24_09640 [Burkholderia ubonensis]KWO87519.1 hypothetical protein WM32_10800 [Burkholderia ubonensis]
MDALFSVEVAVREAVPGIVLRYRSKGTLTWSLLHRIESDVLAEVVSTGKYSKRLLEILRTPEALGFPNDDRPASFEGHDFVPIIFGAIADSGAEVNSPRKHK